MAGRPAGVVRSSASRYKHPRYGRNRPGNAAGRGQACDSRRVSNLLRPASRGGDVVTRPSALARFVALAVGLVIAGCQSGGAGSGTPSTPGSASASQVSVQAPTSLIKASTLTDCVDIEYPPMEYFPSTSVTDP